MGEELIHKWDKVLDSLYDEQAKPLGLVVNFSRLLKQEKKTMVLDLGCGKGRHTVFLARQGFNVMAVDISSVALSQTLRRLKEQGLPAPLVQADLRRLPLPGNTFDALLSLSVLHHHCWSEMVVGVNEMYRVTKPGGYGLLTVALRHRPCYGTGELVETHSYLIDHGADQGIIHHFFDRQEILQLFSEFTIVNARLTRPDQGSWKVLLQKPQ